jgi:carboxypeptidase C (cathepsin A)
VGLTGAVIISPALEFSLLNGSDYDVLPWIDCFPSMAGAAAFHGLSRKIKKDESLEDLRSRAADFALNELLPVLAAGELLPSSRRTRILNIAADYLGFDRQLVNRNNGRISIEFFVKNLLRSKHKLLGLYDASLTVTDPYPDRDNLDGPDPTLHTLERVFAAGINSQLGTAIGLKTERDYNLLSMKVNESWDIDTKQHALETQIGATDDLRYGMSMNPDMKVYITHGTYDLVTPFFSTDRITALMKLSPELKQNLTVRHYPGGHMFYAWEDSRKAFFEEMKIFYK